MVAGEWEEEMLNAEEWCELMVEPSGRFVRRFLLTSDKEEAETGRNEDLRQGERFRRMEEKRF